MGPTPVAQALRELEELQAAPEVNRTVKVGIDVIRSYQLLCAGRHVEANAIRDRVEQDLRELGQLEEAIELFNLDSNLAAKKPEVSAVADRQVVETLEAQGRLGNVGTHLIRLASMLAGSGDHASLEEASVLIEKAKQAMSKMSRRRTSRKDGEARSRLAGSLDGGLITSLRPQHPAGERSR
jgi:uncharacterized membrane protein YccC